MVIIASGCGSDGSDLPAGAVDCPPLANPLPPQPAAELDGLELEVVFAGEEVVAAAPAGDGQLVVAQRTGVLTLVDAAGSRSVLVDLSAHVEATGAEQGLLGVAVTHNDRLVVSYTTADQSLRVSDLGPLEAPGWPGRELLVASKNQPWHASGWLTTSGTDGVLVGVGDDGDPTGSPGPVQDPNSLVGKIFELNTATGARTTIALGVRNPWGIAVDATSNNLWVADVGQSCREEINRIAPDGTTATNLGWPNSEGTLALDTPIPGAITPILEYPHTPHCAVIGGAVYRGDIEQLHSSYLFADYCTGEIFTYQPADDTVRRLPVGATRPTWLGLDTNGELLVASQDTGLHRITSRT
ncbi:MAG: PQQ-dependent sugar dehydrogenase [Sulfitobacter sp.]|nr:PQQ-dependent sugar dehydrogenase [Sulfitobacter sp.]